MRPLLFLALAFVALVSAAPPANRPMPGMVRVRIDTSAGPIVLSLDARHAPKTTANFLAYVDDGRFDDTEFYRAARRKSGPTFGFVQGGIGTDARRILPTFPLEPTNQTGIHHLDATVSMARGARTGSGGGNFILTVGPIPSLDAHGDYPGYAAFGRVVAGMDTVRRILALPTGGGYDAMKDQMILHPVRLIAAHRLDGVAKPTGRAKPWLFLPR